MNPDFKTKLPSYPRREVLGEMQPNNLQNISPNPTPEELLEKGDFFSKPNNHFDENTIDEYMYFILFLL